jgi:hypothetical protein
MSQVPKHKLSNIGRYSLFCVKEPPTPEFIPKIELPTLYTFELG